MPHQIFISPEHTTCPFSRKSYYESCYPSTFLGFSTYISFFTESFLQLQPFLCIGYISIPPPYQNWIKGMQKSLMQRTMLISFITTIKYDRVYDTLYRSDSGLSQLLSTVEPWEFRLRMISPTKHPSTNNGHLLGRKCFFGKEKTPYSQNINVKYYLNLVLVDKEDYCYFKQQEMT
ncbi:Uncharacterized protein Rs2_09590 [Raphanus sativus]|nr:Uncharacterized protein Rs2_09590 [Raphanus sativus]